MADNELKIIIRADDQASETLRGVKESLAGIGDEIEIQGTDAGAWGDSISTSASTAGTAVEDGLNVPMRSASFLLRQIGLEGPANLLQVGDAANKIVAPLAAATGAAGGLWAALAPIVVPLAAIAGGLLVLKGAFDAVRASTGAAHSQLAQFFGSKGPIAGALAPLQRLAEQVKLAIGDRIAKGLVGLLGMAQVALVKGVNFIGKTIINFLNTMIGKINSLLAKIPGLNLSIGLLPSWKDIPLDLSWLKIEAPKMAEKDGGLTGGGEISLPSVGGGGGVSIPTVGGGGGGAGLGAGKKLSNAPGAFTDSADVDRLQLQALERVDGRMQELIDLLRSLPETTRDAIVVYSGGA